MNINYSVNTSTQFNRSLQMRGEQRRSKQQPEDKILGRVFNRLRNSLKIRYEDISEWSKDQGKYISVSCLCDMASGCATNYLSRLPIVARYFREVHAMDYVDVDYLLQGEDEDQEWVQKEKDIQSMIEDSIVTLPFEEHIEKETA
jgi:hypothetical protein